MRDHRPDTDEFYVGYLDSMPASHARRVRSVVMLIVLLAVAAGAAAVGFSGSPGDGRWDQLPRDYTGTLIETPYPMLVMAEGGQTRVALLVDSGKFGAQQRVAGLNGESVTVHGTSLHREGPLMVEIGESADAVRVSATASAASVALVNEGRKTCRGEVVDPKCFFGAMKPGAGKTHKACAILCISGGIPPMLADGPTSTHSGSAYSYCLLTDASGKPVSEVIIPLVGLKVEITGEVQRLGDLEILRVDPADVHPL